jgi:hypothetical protein
MKSFNSLGEFVAHLAGRVIAARALLEAGLEEIGQVIEKTAREELGTYQPAVGPFPAWTDLADNTQQQREAAGFTPNDPLLASGEMRDTFGHRREGLEVVIGSTDEKMIYHEFGTTKMPPRPVFGPAAIRCEKDIEALAGAAAVTGIVGGAAASFSPSHSARGSQCP